MAAVTDTTMSSSREARAEALFHSHQFLLFCQVDHLFACLMPLQWIRRMCRSTARRRPQSS